MTGVGLECLDSILSLRMPLKVGFTIALADYYGNPPPTYREIRRMGQRAESAGFDSIWLYDHLLKQHPQLRSELGL